LESAALEVRVASGENIAMFFETLGINQRRDLEEESYDQDDDEDDEAIEYDDMTRLTELLARLATDSNRRRARSERKAQRSAFRDILKTVEEGDPIQERLKIRKQVINFNTWAKVIQLNAFREAISSGLSVHLEENELLHSVFDFTPPPPVLPAVGGGGAGSRPGSALGQHAVEEREHKEVAKSRSKINKARKGRLGELLLTE